MKATRRQRTVEYDMGVLDALGNGSPCLIEIGSRCMGEEITCRYVANRTIDYNQDNTEQCVFGQLPKWDCQNISRQKLFGGSAIICAVGVLCQIRLAKDKRRRLICSR
jgi:hypothetical protein